MTNGRRPVIGVMCCNEVAHRPVQTVASRFVAPLSRWSQAAVLLVPALRDSSDAATFVQVLDGLLLTGSRSHVAPRFYGGGTLPAEALDEERDEVAMALAGTMIEAGKPVFGICRGMQEINVLFGGSLSNEACAGRHHRGAWHPYEELFDHRHDVTLTATGRLASHTSRRRISVNSVHEQGIERLGLGLAVEAVATDDGVVEAIAARPCGADVFAVQWHPECDAQHEPASRAFFSFLGAALRGESGSDYEALPLAAE